MRRRSSPSPPKLQVVSEINYIGGQPPATFALRLSVRKPAVRKLVGARVCSLWQSLFPLSLSSSGSF